MAFNFKSETMDRELTISAEWMEAWLARTYHPLQCYTLLLVYGISLTMLFIGIRTLFRMRRARLDIENDPSNRAAIFAHSSKRLRTATRTQFVLTNVYLVNALAIWLVDAGIGIWTLKKDVDANPESYDMQVWLDLLIQATSMLAIFTAVFIIFPMLQMFGVGYLIARFHRKNNTDGTLDAYIPEARIVTTQLAHLWMMLGFFVVAFWPVFESSFSRIIVLEAVFGSALAWSHASFAFNFRAPRLAAVEVQPLLGVKDGVKFYGRQVYAAHLGSAGAGALPQYQEVAQSDEKA